MSKIKQIKKRTGQIVDFQPDKIVLAVTRAYGAVRGSVMPDAEIIVAQVIADLNGRFTEEQIPSVENVQDLVELRLMQAGLFDVAKGYIIYRYEHTKTRTQRTEQAQQAILEKIIKNDLQVIKRDGRPEKFSLKKIEKTLSFATRGLAATIDQAAIIQQCEAGLYDGVTTTDIAKALVLAARSFIERDPAYSKVAARLLFQTVYRDAIGAAQLDYSQFDRQYRRAFVDNVKSLAFAGRLDRRLLDLDLERLAAALKPERDDLFVYLGAQVLADRYFISDLKTARIMETPQAFWMRVAMGVALLEENREARAIEFYETISELRLVPSTPTLFHAGTPRPQLSSCYLTTVEDSLDHIFKCIGDNAQMSKWSGGVANDWSSLRATGATIQGTGVESQGVIPFLKIANDTTVAINRSGRRRGATCVYLETWHLDIEDFLELRKNTGDERRRTHDMNTANWIPDLFIQRVRDDQEWTLFSPDETPDLHHIYGQNFVKRYEHYERLAAAGKIHLFKTVRAKDLWKKMLTMLFETGHPWMTFKDPCNVRSPQDHVGVVHSSNLCTEITLNTSADETAVCNLGSVNLTKHLTADGQLDEARIKQTVTTALRMLDNVIDVNYYPTKEGKTSNLRHRPVGLGIMGFQDVLFTANIPFDTDACVRFADRSMEMISYYAILASSQLAVERGTYQSYRGSKWERGIFPIDTLDLLEQERGEAIPVARTTTLDWSVVRAAVKEHGMRNSNCLAIAPTATIANIAGVSPSIEPIYKNVYVKSNMSGEFTIVNDSLVRDLQALGLWNQEMLDQIKAAEGSIQAIDYIPQALKDKYKETFEIEPEWLIRAAAYRGKWIDQSQSLNLFLRGTSGKRIADAYMLAWTLGLKTTYYLRSLAASSVESSTLDLKQQQVRSSVAHQFHQTTVAVTTTPVVAPAKQPVLAAVAETIEQITETIVPKLSQCKLDDPSCESCQ
ncbi:MAG: ribonucleoside-diphosphate reductase subunit alpha [Patescibacteria group bacterium]